MSDADRRVGEREGLSFLTSCPFARCDVRLDHHGLLADHVAAHVRVDGFVATVRAFCATWNTASRLVRLGIAAEASRESPLAREILDALPADGARLRLSVLAGRVGEKVETVRARVRRLAASGVVAVDRRTVRLVVDRRIRAPDSPLSSATS